jgi:hypothetical protein
VGASDDSHVQGPVKKVGTADFTFPLGNSNVYAPLEISNITPLDPAIEFTAEYFHEEHPDPYSFLNPDPIDNLQNVSTVEYWDISDNGLVASASVTLFWNDSARSYITDCADLVVAHYDGNVWENFGQDNCNFGFTGSIRANNITTFSPFTFGSTVFAENPLPVELLEFNAVYNGNYVELNWKTASELNNDFFEVQKAASNLKFEKIGIVNGNGYSNEIIEYQFIDHEILSGASYYRLKQVDYDGGHEYSKVASIYVENPSTQTLVFPNPNNTGHFRLISECDCELIEISVSDLSGQRVLNKSVDIEYPGQFAIDFSLPGYIKAGMYILTVESDEGRFTEKILFTK